jgi:hypothetical protein
MLPTSKVSTFVNSLVLGSGFSVSDLGSGFVVLAFCFVVDNVGGRKAGFGGLVEFGWLVLELDESSKSSVAWASFLTFELGSVVLEPDSPCFSPLVFVPGGPKLHAFFAGGFSNGREGEEMADDDALFFEGFVVFCFLILSSFDKNFGR